MSIAPPRSASLPIRNSNTELQQVLCLPLKSEYLTEACESSKTVIAPPKSLAVLFSKVHSVVVVLEKVTAATPPPYFALLPKARSMLATNRRIWLSR